jgi:hypothetical protein
MNRAAGELRVAPLPRQTQITAAVSVPLPFRQAALRLRMLSNCAPDL